MSDEPFPARYDELAAIVERGSVYANDTHELLRDLRRDAETMHDRARASLLEARWLEKVERGAEALLMLDTARGLCGDDDLLLADVLALRACILAQRGQVMAATEAARSALEKNPAHVEARLAMAHTYFDVQEPRRAISLYHEVLPLLDNPVERAEIHLTIANAYRQLRLPLLARTHARAAMDVTPRDGMALPVSLLLQAAWLRVSSLARIIRWLTLLAVATVLLSGALGGMSWTIAATTVAAVLLVVGAVAWFTTPAVRQAREEQNNSRPRTELAEQEEPAT